MYAKNNQGITAEIGRLHKNTGVKRSTASNYIYNLRQMLRGELYQRAMSVEATDDFLAWIHRDYGADGLKSAVSALEKHIPYFKKSSPSPMTGHVAILKKYEVSLEANIENETAVIDLLERPAGNSAPDRAEKISFFIRRDPEIRKFVVKRSNGRCEFCGCEGFVLPDGSKYVEAHHVITLAKAGADTVDNVIALCANHHREAHFGADASKLEAALLDRLAEINKQSRSTA